MFRFSWEYPVGLSVWNPAFRVATPEEAQKTYDKLKSLEAYRRVRRVTVAWAPDWVTLTPEEFSALLLTPDKDSA